MNRVLGLVMAIILFAGIMHIPANVRAADPTIDGHGLMGDFFKCYKNPENREDIRVFTFDDYRGERAIGNLNGDSFHSMFKQITGTTDYVTARFTGTLVPKYTEDYIFHMEGDDGFRLWINGQLMIDFWKQTWEVPQTSAPISLEAGKHYEIKVEYLQGWGGSWLRMEWESASQRREIVPESALYLPPNRTITNKKAELTTEIQKADFLISQFAGQVTETELNNLKTAQTTAADLLAAIDGQPVSDDEKAALLFRAIEAVSAARSDFMKAMGVTSSSVFDKFNNPLYQGQDPFVTYKDGFYYFVSSSNLDSNNKVYVSKSRTLTDQGEKVLVFDSLGTQTRIFAPEIFFFDGKWYIYYCADLREYGYKHMATVLESVTGDPQGAYVDKGPLYAGEHGEIKQANDFTVFEHQGKLYAVWGTLGPGEPIGPAIAPMDNPYTISADRSFLPGFGGEGPRVLQKDGKVFITMSEGDYASNDYRLSYFTNTDGDFLNPNSWTHTKDVFVSTGDVSGPARAGFVKSADGKEDWMIYHSRVYKDTVRNWWRQVNIKKIGWNSDGTPDFGKPIAPYEWLPLPSGDPGQGDMYQAESAILYGSITTGNSHSYYQGTSYINLPKKPGAEASFVVHAPEAGDYIVGLRYAYGVQEDGETTNHPTSQLPARAKVNVYVNGLYAKTVEPDKTAISWNEWFTGSERLSLQAGNNVISYRIDHGSIGNVNVDYMTMYKADVPNPEGRQLKAALSGMSQVPSGNEFQMNYGLFDVTGSVYGALYAQDLTLSYDAEKVRFISANSLKAGLLILHAQADALGQVRILLASQGADHAVAADGDLIQLNWQAIQETSATVITLSKAQVAGSRGEEASLASVAYNVRITGTLNKEALNTLIAQAQDAWRTTVEGSDPGQYPAGSKAALLAAIHAAQAAGDTAGSQADLDQAANVLSQAMQAFRNSVHSSIPEDTNGDGRVSVGDLSIVAANYGKNSSSPDWNLIRKFDINKDGVIDILDLAAVARKILQ